MMSLDVCRACLEGSKKKHCINNELLLMYRKLVNTKSSKNDENYIFCYRCYWQLQSCLKFSKMARKSEQFLKCVDKSQVSLKVLNLAKQQKSRTQELGTIGIESAITNELVPEIREKVPPKIFPTPSKIFSLNNIKKAEDNIDEESESDIDSFEADTHKYIIYNENMDEQDSAAIEDTKEYIEFVIENPIKNYSFNTDESKPFEMDTDKEYDLVKQEDMFVEYLDEEFLVEDTLEIETDIPIQNIKNTVQIKTGKVEEYIKTPSCKVVKTKQKKNNNDKTYTTTKKYIRPKKFVCETCGTKTDSRGHLEQHQRVHTGERFYCNVCNKGFTQEGSLKRHMKIHLGLHRIRCPICAKVLKHSLKTHIENVHEKLRPFACKLCGKKFFNKSILGLHISQKHTKDSQKYTCDTCNVTLTTRSSILRHMKESKCSVIDKTTKEFVCDNCKCIFPTRPAIYKHISRHSCEIKDIPYIQSKPNRQKTIINT